MDQMGAGGYTSLGLRHSKRTSCGFHISTRIRFFKFCEWRRHRKFGDIMKRMAKFRFQIHNESGDGAR